MGTECTNFRDVGIGRHLLSLKRVPVHARNWHLEKPGDFLHGQMLSVVSVSVVDHCGPLLRNAARTKHSDDHRAVGLERPRELLWARNVHKRGSLQPNPVFCPCPNISSRQCNFFCFRPFRKSEGDPKSDGRVICVLHPPFTLRRRIRADA